VKAVRRRLVTLLYASRWLGLIAGCQHDISTPFPSGLTPIANNPVPQGRPPYTETLTLETSTTGDLKVYGRGYILAEPGTAWAMVKDPMAMVAVCTTTTQTITPNNEPQYEFSFLVDYVVDEILTVQWDDQWRYGTITGTEAEPTLAMMKHQKTDGSSFITLSEGTIELTPAVDDPSVTEVSMVEYLDSVGATIDDLTKGVTHTYESMVAVSHGNPIPACP
jgi:hypothetical protein